MKKGSFPNLEEIELIKRFVKSDLKVERVSAFGFGSLTLICGVALLANAYFRISEVIPSSGLLRVFYALIGVAFFSFGSYLYFNYFRFKREVSSMRFFMHDCVVAKFLPALHHGWDYIETVDGIRYRISREHLKSKNLHFRVAVLDSKKIKYSFAFPSNNAKTV